MGHDADCHAVALLLTEAKQVVRNLLPYGWVGTGETPSLIIPEDTLKFVKLDAVNMGCKKVTVLFFLMLTFAFVDFGACCC